MANPLVVEALFEAGGEISFTRSGARLVYEMLKRPAFKRNTIFGPDTNLPVLHIERVASFGSSRGVASSSTCGTQLCALSPSVHRLPPSWICPQPTTAALRAVVT